MNTDHLSNCSSFALIVGVGETSFKPWSLPVTEHDAVELARFLSDESRLICPMQEMRVLIGTTATRARIISELEWLADTVVNSPNSTVLVFFSGHGFRLGKPRTPSYFLIPHDAQPARLEKTALPASLFSDKIRKIESKRLLVILDCCHAQGMASAKEDSVAGVIQPMAPPAEFLEQLQSGQGRAVISSSTAEQSSWIVNDHNDQLSVFTSCLLEGLRGAASFSGETEISVLRIFEYLSHRVPRIVRSIGEAQQPLFECTGVTASFALARVLESSQKASTVHDTHGSKRAELAVQRIQHRIETKYVMLSDVSRRKQANLWALSRALDPEHIPILKERIAEQELEEDRIWEDIENMMSKLQE